MDKPLYIPILLGTKREQRKSIWAAELVEKVGKEIEGIEVELIDPNDFDFPGDGNDPEGKDPRYTKITERADAFFIVTPEYNHSFPGSLKRMLDSELENYIHKPVAIAGVSKTMWGGVRVIESLLHPARELGLVVTYTDLHFPKVQELFDNSGALLDDSYIEYTKKSYKELLWMATVLKEGRKKHPLVT